MAIDIHLPQGADWQIGRLSDYGDHHSLCLQLEKGRLADYQIEEIPYRFLECARSLTGFWSTSACNLPICQSSNLISRGQKPYCKGRFYAHFKALYRSFFLIFGPFAWANQCDRLFWESVRYPVCAKP